VTRRKDTARYLLLQQALSSPHADGLDPQGNRCSLSGISGPLEANLDILADGGVCIDKRVCDESAVITGVMSGPMADVSLAPGTTDRFCDVASKASPHFLEGLAMSGWGPLLLHGLASGETPERYGSLDRIALDLYAAFWARLGARVGYRAGPVIRWLDGAETPIAKEDETP
jgi:hypothetical protein